MDLPLKELLLRYVFSFVIYVPRKKRKKKKKNNLSPCCTIL